MGGIPKHLLQAKIQDSSMEYQSAALCPECGGGSGNPCCVNYSQKYILNPQRISQIDSGVSQSNYRVLNIDREKLKFLKTSEKKKTIVFDFDETLAKVHFNKKELDHYDDQVDILTKEKTISIFISMRPGLKEVLRELKQHFEIILFTSSSRIYCDGILRNVIENEGEVFFEHKLFKTHLVAPKVFNMASRFHKDNQLIKNLDLLTAGRNLEDMVIVDNRSANYCDHNLNGIPISDYNGDPTDRALYLLKEYLINRILPAEDVRQVIKEDFMDAVMQHKQKSNLRAASSGVACCSTMQQHLQYHQLLLKQSQVRNQQALVSSSKMVEQAI